MVSQQNTPLSQPIPEGVSLPERLRDWKANHQATFEDIAREDIDAANQRCANIKEETTAYRPTTAQELAAQILMATDHGCSDWSNEFFFALIDLAERGEPKVSRRIINPTAHYQPTINMDKCSTYELRRLSDLLWAISELTNAAISDDMSREVGIFLDDFQAFANLVAIRIAEQTFIAGPPSDDYERRNWSWIVARGQLQCAEGEVHIEGPGVPNLADVGGQAE